MSENKPYTHKWVSAKFLSNHFQVSEVTIWTWAKEGKIPSPKKFSRSVTRWDFDKITKAEKEEILMQKEHSVNLPRLMNTRELASYLGKSTDWCERARWAGDGPRFIKLGRHVRYKSEDVMAWIEENTKHSTRE